MNYNFFFPPTLRTLIFHHLDLSKQSKLIPMAPSNKFQSNSAAEKAMTVKDTTEPTLAAEHADYLLQRHGTLDLKPFPSAHHDDPYNWPSWKVNFYEVDKTCWLTKETEKCQPRHCFLSCIHDNVYCRIHYSRFRTPCRVLRKIDPRSQLSHFIPSELSRFEQ